MSKPLNNLLINFFNKDNLNYLFVNKWHFFGFIFLLSFCLKILLLLYVRDAKLGWDEGLYMKHATAIFHYLSNFNLIELYQNYFMINKDAIRFFPPGSPLSYALFRLITDDPLLGARIYNAFIISIGIASSGVIFLKLTRNKILSLILVFIMLLSVEHNAYTIFLWTEGVQFGLLSLVVLLTLGKFNFKRCIAVSLILAWMVLAHASSLAIVAAVVSYIFIFKYKKEALHYKIKVSLLLSAPTLFVIVVLSIFYKPVIGEFVLITSESIPMKSLRNPPSSYHSTWTKIREVSEEKGVTLSEASSLISSEYLGSKDISFLMSRGWNVLKASMAVDTFPARHFKAGKWPFLDNSIFAFLEKTHITYYFFVYVGLILFIFSGRFNGLSFLVGLIFALKIVVVFLTGVAMTRYFSSFFMVIIPLSLYGYYDACYRIRYRKIDYKLIRNIVSALFIGTFVL